MSTEMVTEADVILSEVPPRFKEVCIIRFRKAEFKPSGAGNPQVSLEAEIVQPEKFSSSDGKVYALDSLVQRFYFPMIVKQKEGGEIDKDGTAKARGRYLQFRKLMGLNPSFDASNPGEKEFEGLCAKAVVSSRESIHQRQKPDGGYEPIIDEATKKPLTRGWEIPMGNIADILGRAEVDTNKPY